MKKNFFAAMMAVLLCAVFATPAFAAGINSNEQALLDKFNAAVDSKVGVLLESNRAESFKANANSALNNDAIDLDEAACNELSAKLDEVLAYIDANVPDKATAKAKYAEIAGMINQVSEKYGIKVLADVADQMGEVQVNGKTVASTKSTVNQTGFGVAQTAVVAAAAVATISGAYVVARKNRLFA